MISYPKKYTFGNGLANFEMANDLRAFPIEMLSMQDLIRIKETQIFNFEI